MSQNYFYPPSSGGSVSIPAVGINGAAIPSSSILIAGENPSLNLQPLQTDAGGSLLVNDTAGTKNVNLIQISGSAITLGQKAMANSLPVVIASDQSTLTVSVSNFPATQPVSGTITVVQPTGSNLHADIDNFPATQVVSQSTAANLNATVVQSSGTNLHVNVDNFPGTQPISGTVTANAGTGTFLVDGSAHTQPISGTVTANAGTGTFQVNQVTVLGTLSQAAVAVGTTAIRCTVSGSAPNAARKELVVQPDPASTAKFYIGSSSVTSSGANRGVPLAAGQIFIADDDSSDYYIISDTAAQTFFVMESV